ncbi:hypothetical protein PTKIN_Ptkin05aG0053200 [Pterospermum kingtungense]
MLLCCWDCFLLYSALGLCSLSNAKLVFDVMPRRYFVWVLDKTRGRTILSIESLSRKGTVADKSHDAGTISWMHHLFKDEYAAGSFPKRNKQAIIPTKRLKEQLEARES